jgi:hypothetical protein
MQKTFVLTVFVLWCFGCGGEESSENSDPNTEQTTNSQPTGNREPVDECRDSDDCNFDGAGDSTPFLDVSNVQCREADNGKICSECLSDEDCRAGYRCSSQTYCMSVQ